jgi:hypothetical protein
MSPIAALHLARLDVPLVPDAPDARDLVQRELAKPEYATSKPSLWDIISKAFWDWINSLRVPDGGPFSSLFPVIVMIVVVVAVVIAFLIWGVPRLNRRSRLQTELFGENDSRTSDELRRAARAAAANGDWTLAIEELYRATARGLSERTIVTVMPGTTAHGFATRASTSFPAEQGRLHTAADAFDAVRYLGAVGTEAQYLDLDALDRSLAASSPARFEEPEAVSA